MNWIVRADLPTPVFQHEPSRSFESSSSLDAATNAESSDFCSVPTRSTETPVQSVLARFIPLHLPGFVTCRENPGSSQRTIQKESTDLLHQPQRAYTPSKTAPGHQHHSIHHPEQCPGGQSAHSAKITGPKHSSLLTFPVQAPLCLSNQETTSLDTNFGDPGDLFAGLGVSGMETTSEK